VATHHRGILACLPSMSNDPATFESLHPDFSDEGGDIILCSKDGKRFRTSSYTLRTTSAQFRTTLSLPQGPRASVDIIETLHLDEEGATLEGVLRMISGSKELPSLESLDVIEEYLYTAEKYEMPAPISICQLAILSPLVDFNPFHVYRLACRYGWKKEASLASARTLSYDISDEMYKRDLHRMDAKALANLLRLR
jgi:hypothetical protein